MARLFLSHSSRDNVAALALRDWLAAEGWDDVFLDLDPERGIVSGQRWEQALHQAAQRCEAVLFLISANWLASEWCAREFDLATRLGKLVFGVVVDETPLAEIPARYTDTWQLTSLVAGQDGELFATRLPPEGKEAFQVFSRDGLRRLRAGLQRAGLDPRHFDWPPADDPKRPPYRGLRPLEAADAGIFFGREAALVGALDQLRQLRERSAPRLLVILGASGAGKSSFLRAGLLPRLARDDRHFLPLQPIRPERDVLGSEHGLVAALHAAFERLSRPRARPELAAAARSGEGLTALLADVARLAQAPTLPGEPPSAPPAVVLSVDQAEELFQAEGAEQAARFLESVAAAATSAAVRVLVLFTIRTDLYAPLQSAPALSGLRQELFSLAAMPVAAYREVIEGPARRVSGARMLRVPAQVSESLAEVAARGGGDALPLLAFTLEKLWHDHGATGWLAPEGYDVASGFAEAMSAAVDRALEAAARAGVAPAENGARLALLRRALIPWMAGIDPATRAPRRRRARLSEVPAEARGLIGHLVEARVLSTDMEAGEAVVEPAHEALLRRWGVLRGWLEEDVALLTALEGVLEASRAWDANARDAAWLAHKGGRLIEAEALRGRDDLWAKLGPAGSAYLAGCRAAENAQIEREKRDAEELLRKERERADAEARVLRRTRIGGVIGGVLLMVAAGAGWYAYEREISARERERWSFIASQEAYLEAERSQRSLTADFATTETLLAVQRNARASANTARAVLAFVEMERVISGYRSVFEQGDSQSRLLRAKRVFHEIGAIDRADLPLAVAATSDLDAAQRRELASKLLVASLRAAALLNLTHSFYTLRLEGIPGDILASTTGELAQIYAARFVDFLRNEKLRIQIEGSDYSGFRPQAIDMRLRSLTILQIESVNREISDSVLQRINSEVGNWLRVPLSAN